MQQDQQNRETFTLSVTASMLGASKRVLPDAAPLWRGAERVNPDAAYGWIMDECQTPTKGDHYLVEFVGKRQFRIFAYADRFGRVFAVDKPIGAPPARTPDLNFARFSDLSTAKEERGCIEMLGPDGVSRQVAQYACSQGRYRLFDTWYDFGPHGVDLSFDDAVARAYFAFVLRPQLGGASVPARGMGFVYGHLRNENLLVGLRSFMSEIKAVEADPVVNPPALARCLARWLGEAGLESETLKAAPDDALRLVRTVRFADTFFVAADSEESPFTKRDIWAVESALNRFLLVDEAFGDNALMASEADCLRWETYFIEAVGVQPLVCELASGESRGLPHGEWESRCRLGAAIERFKLPVRLETRMRLCSTEGVAAFEVTVPDASLMPALVWVDGQPAPGLPPAAGSFVVTSDYQRDVQARRYAMHLGLMLAAATFESAPSVVRVDIVARPVENEGASKGESPEQAAEKEQAQQGEFPVDQRQPAYYQVTFTREAYEQLGHFRPALEGEPATLYQHVEALFDVVGADAFSVIEAVVAAAEWRYLPEAGDATFRDETREVLGAYGAAGVRIEYDAYRRRIGEGLADRIACAESATEAIRIVREVQESADERTDDQTSAACTQLMAALAEGSLDTGDQNAVVGCFLGEDRCQSALNHARTLAEVDPAGAVSVLMDAVTEAAALDGFVDGATKVYRSFDSYAARILYNRELRRAETRGMGSDEAALAAARDVPTLESVVAGDVGKRVLLVPDSYYLCHLEIVRLLERSFDRIDEALRYGRRAIDLAPASAAGYRQLGRAYMLVGDMEHAIATLDACLRVAVQPSDIAVAYYQLAYTLWKTGHPETGAACYLKSIVTAPVIALQAMTELRELVAEHHLEPPDRDELDEVLEEAGVVLAPTEEAFEVLDSGSAAATDANMFPVAHNLLLTRLQHRADDALINVLRSLEK